MQALTKSEGLVGLRPGFLALYAQIRFRFMVAFLSEMSINHYINPFFVERTEKHRMDHAISRVFHPVFFSSRSKLSALCTEAIRIFGCPFAALHYPFKYFLKMLNTSSKSNGLPTWSFMPAARHFSMSSRNTLAVMAMMGSTRVRLSLE